MISVKNDNNKVIGYYNIEKTAKDRELWTICVTSSTGKIKKTQLGGSLNCPEALARLILSEPDMQ